MSELFAINQKEIYHAAALITRKRNINLAPELVSETYLTLQKKQPPTDQVGYLHWFNKSMKQLFEFRDSSFNKIYKLDVEAKEDKHRCYIRSRYGEQHTQHTPTPTCETTIPDEEALNDINILVESTNDETKELIEISSGMRKERVLKYIEILEFKNSLPLPERFMFELHYEKDLSGRQIEQMLKDVQYRTISSLIKSIKSKIKVYKWK